MVLGPQDECAGIALLEVSTADGVVVIQHAFRKLRGVCEIVRWMALVGVPGQVDVDGGYQHLFPLDSYQIEKLLVALKRHLKDSGVSPVVKIATNFLDEIQLSIHT